MTPDPDDRRPRDAAPGPHDGAVGADGALDALLRAHLDATVPGHRAGFWDDLAATLDASPQERPSNDLQGNVRALRPSPRKAAAGSHPEAPTSGEDAMTTTDPIPAGYDEVLSHGGSTVFGRRPGSGARWLMAAAAAAVVATGAGVGLALRGSETSPTPPADTAIAAPTPSDSPSGSPSVKESEKTVEATVSPTATAAHASTGGGGAKAAKPDASGRYPVEVTAPTTAVVDIAKSGAGVVPGSPENAWTWRDSRYTHLLLATIERQTEMNTDAEGKQYTRTSGAITRIYYARGTDADHLEFQRTMTDDNGGYCDVDFGAEITPGSVTAFDADGDGVSEATIGWQSQCAGDPSPLSAKIALLAGKAKFIVRGSGVPESWIGREELKGIEFPEATFTPEPAWTQWPGTSYNRTATLYRSLWK